MNTTDRTRSPRRTIATFDSYADAQRVVDHLSDGGFPVDRVTIVGRDLKFVERVVGRMTTGRAALNGALNGAMIGALLGLLAGLIFTIDPNPVLPLLVLYGIVSGAILGALLGAALHAMTGGQRDFASVSALDADRFDVQVDDDVADRAAELLRALDGAAARTAASS
jgi:uncharacterized membrane protein